MVRVRARPHKLSELNFCSRQFRVQYLGLSPADPKMKSPGETGALLFVMQLQKRKCPLWVASGCSLSYQPNDRYRGLSGRQKRWKCLILTSAFGVSRFSFLPFRLCRQSASFCFLAPQFGLLSHRIGPITLVAHSRPIASARPCAAWSVPLGIDRHTQCKKRKERCAN